MAIIVIHDPFHDRAALGRTTSGWVFGPLFYGVDAAGKAERFLQWFADGEAAQSAAGLGIVLRRDDDDDPRAYLPADLERLYHAWYTGHVDPSTGELTLKAAD